MTRRAYETRERFLRACRAEGANPRRLGTMSHRTRQLWLAARRASEAEAATARRREGGW